MKFIFPDSAQEQLRQQEEAFEALALIKEGLNGLHNRGTRAGFSQKEYQELFMDGIEKLFPASHIAKGTLVPQEDGVLIANSTLDEISNNQLPFDYTVEALMQIISKDVGVILKFRPEWKNQGSFTFHSWALHDTSNDTLRASRNFLNSMSHNKNIFFITRLDWHPDTYNPMIEYFRHVISNEKPYTTFDSMRKQIDQHIDQFKKSPYAINDIILQARDMLQAKLRLKFSNTHQ